jgi:hypothetical protein
MTKSVPDPRGQLDGGRKSLRRLDIHELERVDTGQVLERGGWQLGILEAIRAALVRLDHGTDGSCASRGVWIEPARLEAIPYARRCVPCQRGVEHT